MTSNLHNLPTYHDYSRFNYSSSSVGSTQLLNQQFSKTIDSPMGRVNRLSLIERATFMPRWSAFVIKIRVVMDEMSKRGSPKLEIAEVSDALYTELYLKVHQFLDQTDANLQTCRDWHVRAENFARRLQEISFTYPDFSLSPEKKPPSAMNLIRATKQTPLKCDAPAKVQFPSVDALTKCIQNHPATNKAYILNEGIVKDAASFFANGEKTQDEIEQGIMHVIDQQDWLYPQSKTTVHETLKHVLEDCTK